MKVMISIPMNGRSDSDIKNELNKLKAKFAKLHIDVIDTFFEEEVEGYETPALYFIGKSIQKLGIVDALYLAKGWQTAKGCCIERQIAEQYGVKILPEDFLEEPVVETVKWYADNKPIPDWLKPNQMNIMPCSGKHVKQPDGYRTEAEREAEIFKHIPNID